MFIGSATIRNAVRVRVLASTVLTRFLIVDTMFMIIKVRIEQLREQAIHCALSRAWKVTETGISAISRRKRITEAEDRVALASAIKVLDNAGAT